MSTKLCKMLTYGEAKLIMTSHNSDHEIARGHVSSLKLNICPSTWPIPPDYSDVSCQEATHGVT